MLEQSANPARPASWTVVPGHLYRSNSVGFYYPSSAAEDRLFYRLRRLGSPVPGLVGDWSLDEGGGETGANQRSPGISLEMTNVVWAAGRIGPGSIQFSGGNANADGSRAWVSNTNFVVLPPNGDAFSVSLWISPQKIPLGWSELMGSLEEGTNRWQVGLNSLGPGTNYVVLTDGSGSAVVSGRALLVPGRWYPLTLSYAGGRASLYLDYHLLAQGPIDLVNGQGQFYLGGTSSRAGFQGRVDELRVHGTALSEEQISLVGQWYFDENTGSLAADSSVQGHPAAVVPAGSWVPGRNGAGIDLAGGPSVIANDDQSVLPPTGSPFSLSLWICPRELPARGGDLVSCTDGTNGWRVEVDADPSGQSWLGFNSLKLGGTLDLRTPFPLTNGVWTKLDLTYNGGIATVYANGRKLHSDFGAIRAARAALVLGAPAGTVGFNGAVDELKVYSRHREQTEVGPVALPIWEMALLNSSTNLLLQGYGPAGRRLTFSVIAQAVQTRGTILSSPESPVITYIAGAQKGPDSFVYTVSDGEFVSAPATGVVSVVQPHWLSPTGGASLPCDGSSPERAWAAGTAAALDAIWGTNTYYDCFLYSPGEFQTAGWKHNQRFTAHPGCKHIGAASEGPRATTIKLVGAWEAWTEGLIFGGQSAYTDGFEVRNLVLDCNADHNPKQILGEPVWLRVPLEGTGRVDRVTLRWADPSARSSPYQLGRAAEFKICARTPSTSGYITNCVMVTGSGQEDVVDLETEADELLVWLNRRADNVSYYGLREMEVAGARVSLPEARIPGGGESRIDPWHTILMAVDNDNRTSWASGLEAQAQITLPLEPGARVSQINLRWNCQTLPDLKRLGAAAAYVVYGRDPASGQWVQLPFVSHGRHPDGQETVTLGTTRATNSVTTDRLMLVLMLREPGVDYYSLREVSLRDGGGRVPLRIPGSLNAQGSHHVVKAFDGDTNTYWASGTQGSVAAVDVGGSNLKFTGLKVIGFGGRPGRECFPLAVLGPTPSAERPPFRNVLVEDCLFTQPSTNLGEGLTVVALLGQSAGGVVNGIVRRCTVRGVRSSFGYSHAFTAVHVENCIVEDCQFGVYFEPMPGGFESAGQVLIRSNQFHQVYKGISIDFHPGANFDTLLCLDNEIVLDGTPGLGISACDACARGANGTVTNLVALNNIVRYRDWLPRPNAADGGLFYSNIRHAVFGNNLVALGNPYAFRVRPYPAGLIPDRPLPEDCDNPRLVVPGPSTYPSSVDTLAPGYRRAWFNNRELSGALMPVLYSEWGITRPASQQQWTP